MSAVVRKDRSAYPKHLFAGFPASRQYDLVTARAMMWLSQLAYETDDKGKVDSILSDWELTNLGFKTNNPGTGLPPHSACVVVAEGQGATFVTFAGSDPLKFQDWITDFSAMPSPSNLHSGFEQAVETVLPDIQLAFGKRAAPNQTVFFTGHSLGGALAILAAWRISRLQNAPKLQSTRSAARATAARNSLKTIRRGLAISPSAWFTVPTSCQQSHRCCLVAIVMSDRPCSAQPAEVSKEWRRWRAKETRRISSKASHKASWPISI